MSNARLGTFDDLLNERAETNDLKSIAQKLRDVILEGYSEATEVVRLGDGAACYGVGPKKMSEAHVYIMPKPSYINLGFFHATDLPDPKSLLEGTGKKMRHVKIHNLEKAQAPAIKALISAALQERKEALGLA